FLARCDRKGVEPVPGRVTGPRRRRDVGEIYIVHDNFRTRPVLRRLVVLPRSVITGEWCCIVSAGEEGCLGSAPVIGAVPFTEVTHRASARHGRLDHVTRTDPSRLARAPPGHREENIPAAEGHFIYCHLLPA